MPAPLAFPALALLALAAGATAEPSAGPAPKEAAALLLPQGPDAADRLLMRPWGQRPEHWVAVLAEPTNDSAEAKRLVRLHVAVIGRREGRWALVASTEQQRGLVSLGDPRYALDLAAFRLNDSQVAFGVRET